MLYREIIAVCAKIHTKHINTVCGQNVELWTIKPAVHLNVHYTSVHAVQLPVYRRCMSWRGPQWGSVQRTAGSPRRTFPWAVPCRSEQQWWWTYPCRHRWRLLRSWRDEVRSGKWGREFTIHWRNRAEGKKRMNNMTRSVPPWKT